MASLKDTALSFKTERKDITSLESIPTNVEVKEGSFEKNGQKIAYKFIEVNGWKYPIKAALMEKIQQIISARPSITKIKVGKTPNGELFVIPLD